uniref:Uncharacterized protein n=1 Tax=Chloropicon primus TaxID=1764295 RepID=A0A7S2SXX2_9CHLO
MAAGAIIGCVLGAAFATEAQRRGNREERKQREAELKNLEENLESLKVEKETKEKAAEVMEKAKVALEDKIAELEKFAAARGQEAAKEKETRERLVASLKARVKSVMDAISNQDTMEKEVLVKIMHNLLEEDLFGEKKVMSATDENTLSVSEHGNVTVKNTMASPARMFKLGSNRGTKVFQDSTNSAGGARFRIPLFSKQEQVVQPQAS